MVRFVYVKIPQWDANKSASRLYVYALKVEFWTYLTLVNIKYNSSHDNTIAAASVVSDIAVFSLHRPCSWHAVYSFADRKDSCHHTGGLYHCVWHYLRLGRVRNVFHSVRMRSIKLGYDPHSMKSIISCTRSKWTALHHAWTASRMDRAPTC